MRFEHSDDAEREEKRPHGTLLVIGIWRWLSSLPLPSPPLAPAPAISGLPPRRCRFYRRWLSPPSVLSICFRFGPLVEIGAAVRVVPRAGGAIFRGTSSPPLPRQVFLPPYGFLWARFQSGQTLRGRGLHPPCDRRGGFHLLIAFGRCKLRLTDEPVSSILESIVGGRAVTSMSLKFLTECTSSLFIRI